MSTWILTSLCNWECVLSSAVMMLITETIGVRAHRCTVIERPTLYSLMLPLSGLSTIVDRPLPSLLCSCVAKCKNISDVQRDVWH